MTYIIAYFFLGLSLIGGEVSFGLMDDPKSLDPIMFSGSSMPITSNIYEGLVRIDLEGNIVPALADSWVVSEDKVLFKLRDNIRWEDGSEICVEDFLFAAERLLSPNSPSPFVTTYYPIKNAKAFHKGEVDFTKVGIKKAGEGYLEITFEHKSDDLMGSWGSIFAFTPFTPLKKEFFRGKKSSFGDKDDHVMACGPYKVKEWVSGNYILLEKNIHYYSSISIDTLRGVVIRDSKTMINMYRVGDIDLILSLGSEVEDIDEDEIFEYDRDNRVAYIEFNVKGKLANSKLRRDIAHSIERDELCRSSLGGRASPARRFVPPANLKRSRYYGDSELFNEETRIKSLEKEGSEIEDYKDISPLRLICGNSDLSVRVGQYVAEEIFDKLGIIVELEPLSPVVRSHLMERGDYDMSLSGYMVDHTGPPFDFLEIFTSGSSNNRSGWRCEEFDALINYAYFAYRLEDKFSALYAAEKVICDSSRGDFPIAPLYFRISRYAKKPWLKGLKVYSGAGSPDFREAFLTIFEQD